MQTPLTLDQQFFYTHAGSSYNPATQTPEEGKRQTAVTLAAAESVLMRAMRSVDSRGLCFLHLPDDGSPEEWQAFIWRWSAEGRREILASLGGIDDSSGRYMRVIRAELALECLPELNRIVNAGA